MVVGQGQRLDGARAAAARGHRTGGRADDRQREVSARGDARRACRAASGAGGRARIAALADSDSVTVPERGLRARNGGRCRRARSRRASPTWRSAICSSKTSAAIAKRHSQAPGLTPIFPLFGVDTTMLSREMVAGGLRARLTCVNPKVLDARFAGRDFDGSLLDDLPASVDPCGERGEFHSFAYAGPMFSKPIDIQSGEIVRPRRVRLRRRPPNDQITT